MKKKYLIPLLLLVVNVVTSQIISTGILTFPIPDRTVKFDVNLTTDVVTMTMTLPDNTWFGIGLSNDTGGIRQGEDMGSLNDDAIIGLNLGIEDRNMQAGLGTPPLDNTTNVSDEWLVSSNTVSSGIRTIIATRNRDTGDNEDFIFPTNFGTSLNMLFAAGNSGTFGFHNIGYGHSMQTLTNLKFEEATIDIYPNPTKTTLHIVIPTNEIQDAIYIEFYNVLGKKVLQKTITKLESKISVANWSNGVYVMKLSSGETGKSITKRFIKI